MLTVEKNIILIGMPGVGKSTIGVLLAKQLSRLFIDTDIYIQALEARRLQEIIDDIGLKEFSKLEQQHILCIDALNAVIATGGSVVYGQQIMEQYQKNDIIIHLDLPLEDICERITNLDSRGVVMEKTQTLESLYNQRMPLYRKYSHITIDTSGLNQDQTLREILKSL